MTLWGRGYKHICNPPPLGQSLSVLFCFLHKLHDRGSTQTSGAVDVTAMFLNDDDKARTNNGDRQRYGGTRHLLQG